MNHSATLNIHLFATLFMVGLIWFIQIVHYPMLGDVGASDFVRFEQIHQQRTTWVVMPVMLLEFAIAAYFLFNRPAHVPALVVYIAFAILLGVWATTFFLSVPCHNVLSQGFDAVAHRKLVLTNWFRTIGWTARGFLAIWMATVGNRY